MKFANKEMIASIFKLDNTLVREVMVPRIDMVALQADTPLKDALEVVIGAGHSRIPVYKENIDNIAGLLYAKDLLEVWRDGEDDVDLAAILRAPLFVPETKKLDDLLEELQQTKVHLAVVVDEYGGTAGIVSLSRLVEEIVGEVGDELAGLEKDYEIINDYTFQIDGGMHITEANEEMELELPEGEDYETVAGFILSLLGHIPRRNEQLRYHDLKIVITEMKGQKVEKILLTREKRNKTEPDTLKK